MAKKVLPPPGMAQLAETWSRVMSHWDRLKRCAAAMAAVDRRLDPDDLFMDAVAGIVECEGHYRREDSAWMTWAKFQVWKARTIKLRELNEHESRGRLSIGTPNREDEADVVIELPVPDGAVGSVSRAEAQIELSELLAEATEEELDALLVMLYGWSPKMAGGRKGLERSIRSLIDWVSEE